ncbi:hypothetical protein [Alysiella crassa]|nr:hypothetical protein [Alysiella crassa]
MINSVHNTHPTFVYRVLKLCTKRQPEKNQLYRQLAQTQPESV